MANFISALADAITRQEGFHPGTRAWRNNNPGNIWDGVGGGKTSRIWPSLPIDDRGFVIYPSVEAGRAALERDLALKVNRGMSLTSLLNMYAPPIENNTAAYIANVSTWLGINPSQDLRQVAGNWGGSAAPSAPAGPAIVNAGNWNSDWFQVPELEGAELLVVAAAVMVAAAAVV